MKTKTLTLSAIFCLGLIFQGCEKESDDLIGSNTKGNYSKEKDINNKSLNEYDQLSLEITNSLNFVADELSLISSSFDDEEDVLASFENYYEGCDSCYQTFLDGFNNIDNQGTLNSDIAQVITEIETGLSISNSSNDFVDFLDNKFDETLQSGLSTNDKNFLLNYITSYKASVQFISNNRILIHPTEPLVEGWWMIGVNVLPALLVVQL